MIRIQEILDKVAANNHDANLELIQKAYVFAATAHAGQTRLSGEPYLSHPLAVAYTLADMGFDEPTVAAGLLHDTVEDTGTTIEEIDDKFGEDVADIVDGVTKISMIVFENKEEAQAENIRKMILAMSHDMRVLMVKLADRLHNMSTLDFQKPHKQRRIAQETMDIYAPLANRLGLYLLKRQLEDLSFKYLRPDIYNQIDHWLDAHQVVEKQIIEKVVSLIQDLLASNGLEGQVYGRIKHKYSIYKKMQSQSLTLDEMHDIMAFRVLVKDIRDCYAVLGLVHSQWKPVHGRFKDYISMPKANGYQSLHTTVIGPEGERIEIQIRTEEMHRQAEHGVAAHWLYKEKGRVNSKDLEQFSWLREIFERQGDEADSREFMHSLKLDLFKDEVYVYTPAGDVKELPEGATPLDFAFHIHSKLGCKCIGAKVNGKNAQLKQILNSGDQVEIMTSNTQTPKQDWLNIVTTSKARTKIRQALKEMAARQHAFAKETLERKFKNRKIEYDEGTMMRLIKRLGFKVVTDFYQSIADETLDVNGIIDKYLELQKRENDTHDDIVYRSAEGYNLQAAALPEETTAKEDVLVIDQNLKGLDFKLARCCNPIYGDEVFGFVTVSGGIKIHRCDCPNASDLRERFGYRIVKARWAGKSQGTQYPITLRVVGHDDIGIVTNITSIISKETGITLRSIGIDSHDGLFSGTLTIMVGDTGRLEALIKKLRTVKGVKQVSRN